MCISETLYSANRWQFPEIYSLLEIIQWNTFCCSVRLLTFHMASVNGRAALWNHQDPGESICIVVTKFASQYFSLKKKKSLCIGDCCSKIQRNLHRGPQKSLFHGQSKWVAKFKPIFARKRLWWSLSPTPEAFTNILATGLSTADLPAPPFEMISKFIIIFLMPVLALPLPLQPW